LSRKKESLLNDFYREARAQRADGILKIWDISVSDVTNCELEDRGLILCMAKNFAPLKRRSIYTRLHDPTSQKTVTFILAAVRT
jgi:hypothetical protein